VKEIKYLDSRLKSFKNYFQITLLKPKYNLGFAAGNNYALRRIESQYYLLLNCDTVLIDSNTLSECLDYFRFHNEIGMLSPKICFYSDPNRIWYAGAKVNPASQSFSYHIGINQMDKEKFHHIMETDYASGAALFVRNEVIQKIGLMDEIFFMYVEETEWNYRTKEAGYKIIYFPKTRILHKVEVITTKNRFGSRKNAFQPYLYSRNKIIFTLIHFPFKIILFFFGVYQLRTLLAEFFLSIRYHNSQFLSAQIRSIIMGLLIGIRRRTHRKCNRLLRLEMNYLNSFEKNSNSSQNILHKIHLDSNNGN
jgi:hypothetical protein